MKELLLQMARYNLWANKRVIDVLLKLNDEQLDQEIKSSFTTIRSTVYHSWGAEDIWLQRIQLVETPVWKVISYTGSFEDACKQWQEASAELITVIEKQFDERNFQHVIQYYTSKKELFKNELGSILQHVFNHATYHRGQLVTMLRQLGETKIPATDFIAYVRGQK